MVLFPAGVIGVSKDAASFPFLLLSFHQQSFFMSSQALAEKAISCEVLSRFGVVVALCL